jgi:hypothetical protein
MSSYLRYRTLVELRLEPTRRLLRMASARTLKNPGPDLALTEIFRLVKLPHSRETIEGLMLSRQGGLDLNFKIFAYEHGEYRSKVLVWPRETRKPSLDENDPRYCGKSA